ncbi:MAG: hypothetical protein HONBIEJF_02371 [Fimbriimonadaceae bacterium]|nr:hypothetical protein [Fimbriimonadaceae bacterium]
MNKFVLGFGAALVTAAGYGQVVDFEDVTLGAGNYYNGNDGAGGFVSRAAAFNNTYDTNWDFWGGWAASRVVDTTTEGFGNQYASFAGGGLASAQYGVAFNSFRGEAVVGLPAAPVGLWLSNTTYAALSMRNGDGFAKKFGGTSGNDPDWFRLTIFGMDGAGQQTGAEEVYLADFRFADNDLDYILDEWKWVDLTTLGNAIRLEFRLESSDVGQFGINTPTYFSIDDIHLVPEPMTVVALGVGFAACLRRRR